LKIAMIGLGRMGMNMAKRLLRGGHRVIAYNRTSRKTIEIVQEGAEAAYSFMDLSKMLEPPRIVWMMLPAGPAVDDHLESLRGVLSEGDIVIDGGNSYYKDALRRSSLMAGHGIVFLDAGVSGGIWGLEKGYCLMIGGPREVYERLLPLLEALAPEGGHLHCGPSGAGHFVKMVHNGIEYAMMQAYAEGFQIINASPYAESINFGDLAHLWNQGSVIRSWLLELAEIVFKKDPRLEGIRGIVDDSGEGRWTVQQAIETSVSAPAIVLALMSRFRSKDDNSFSDRLVASLRREFGGHSVVGA
jgi:6-phosphogluconate dehydrogenase